VSGHTTRLGLKRKATSMVLINKAINEVTVKVVYYGPGLCGKTTNLEKIYGNPKVENKGKMISMATETDRTLFFDFLPMELGTIGGQKVRVQLYTVPGQVFYDATRKLVLRGADGVVFVADSQESMRSSNIDSLENLKTNLRINRIDPNKVAIVYQYNKRDLPNIDSVEAMNGYMNPGGVVPIVEAAALQGSGVTQTLRAVIARILENLKANVDTTLYDEPPLSSPDMSARSGVTHGSAGTPKLSMRTEGGGLPLPRTSSANSVPTPPRPMTSPFGQRQQPQAPQPQQAQSADPALAPAPFFNEGSAESFAPASRTTSDAAFEPTFDTVDDDQVEVMTLPSLDAAQPAAESYDPSAFIIPDEDTFVPDVTAEPFGESAAATRDELAREDAFAEEPSAAFEAPAGFAERDEFVPESGAERSNAADSASPFEHAFEHAFERSEARWNGDAVAAEDDPFATEPATHDELSHDGPFGNVAQHDRGDSESPFAERAHDANDSHEPVSAVEATPSRAEPVSVAAVSRGELSAMLDGARDVVAALEQALSRAREHEQLLARALAALE
jgi:signal recognition particle receptor subunit beta